MLLSRVFKDINKKFKNIKFKNIKFNSKDCKQNDIFFALKGNHSDGKKYINDAITVSYTHLRAHETPEHLVCRLLR